MQLTDAEIEKLRRSGIRLDAQGRFWHDGQEVTHHGMREAFFRWLDRNADGRYVLRLDEKRFVYLDVDEAPFLIRSLRWQDDRALAVLSDGSEEALDLSTVRLKDGVAFATVKGRFDARLSTTAWTTLGERMTETDGHYYVQGHRLS